MTNRNIPRHAYPEQTEPMLGTGSTAAQRFAPCGSSDAEAVLREEWTARPPGRLGRRLLAEIESYLAFFAVARSHSGDREPLQAQQTDSGGRT